MVNPFNPERGPYTTVGYQPRFREVKSSLLGRVTRLYRQYRRFVASEERRRIIDPNRDSDTKVERYTLGLSHTVTIGTACALSMVISPDIEFRAQEVTSNAEEPGMFFINGIRTANVSPLIGGTLDAFTLNKLAVDYPTMGPAHKFVITGQYTGQVPRRLKNEHLRCYIADLEGLERLLRQRLRLVAEQKTLNKAKKLALATLKEFVPPEVDRFTNVMPQFVFNVNFTGPATLCA